MMTKTLRVPEIRFFQKGQATEWAGLIKVFPFVLSCYISYIIHLFSQRKIFCQARDKIFKWNRNWLVKEESRNRTVYIDGLRI